MQEYKKLEFHQLHKADIILTTQRNHPLSAMIRAATNSRVSHSMMVIDYTQVIESVGEGVVVSPWSRASQGTTLAIAMRYKGLYKEADQDRIIAEARKFLGRKYDAAGAIGSGMVGNRRNQMLFGAGCIISAIGCSIVGWKVNRSRTPIYMDDKFFCSELVARAYHNAGFPLIKADPTNVSPCGVYDSTVLDPIGYLIDKPAPANPKPSWKTAKIG